MQYLIGISASGSEGVPMKKPTGLAQCSGAVMALLRDRRGASGLERLSAAALAGGVAMLFFAAFGAPLWALCERVIASII